MDIAGHSAVVTGGGSGMGAETARRLARSRGEASRCSILNGRGGGGGRRRGGRARYSTATSRTPSAVENAAIDRGPVTAHGPARICVNCAGIAPARRIIGRERPGCRWTAFRRVIEVNLVGTFNVMRVCASAMADLEPVNETGERGVLIATASVAAYEGQIGQAAYAASKAGSCGPDVAGRAGSRGPRHPRHDHRTGPHGDTDAGRHCPMKFATALPRRCRFRAGSAGRREFADLVEHVIGNAMLNGSVIRLDGAIRLEPRVGMAKWPRAAYLSRGARPMQSDAERVSSVRRRANSG